MNTTIEIDGLRKRFGPAQALDEMTFTVRPGQGTGFVGPNAAGKSTTMRVVVGLDAPGAGTATIGGQPYRTPTNPLRHVGTLLDAGALQPSRSARNQLPWLAHSQGLGYASLTSGADIRAAVGAVLYPTLIALLSLGVAAAVRDSAAAIGLVLGLLYLFPIAAAGSMKSGFHDLVSAGAVPRKCRSNGPARSVICR